MDVVSCNLIIHGMPTCEEDMINQHWYV